jgi:hypothetical protein
VLLQVVNLVLQPGAEHLEADDFPLPGVELEVIEVLDDFELAGQHARQLDGLSLGGRVVIGSLQDDRIIDDHELPDRRDAERAGDAELAHAERGVLGDGHLHLDALDRHVRRRRRTSDLGTDAGAFEEGLVGASEVHLTGDFDLGGGATLHRDRVGVGDHREGSLGVSHGSIQNQPNRRQRTVHAVSYFH